MFTATQCKQVRSMLQKFYHIHVLCQNGKLCQFCSPDGAVEMLTAGGVIFVYFEKSYISTCISCNYGRKGCMVALYRGGTIFSQLFSDQNSYLSKMVVLGY